MRKINYEKVAINTVLVLLVGLSAIIEAVYWKDTFSPILMYLNIVFGLVCGAISITMAAIYTCLYYSDHME